MALIKIGNRILNTDAISWVQLIPDESTVLVYLNHSETTISDEDEAKNPHKLETAWMLFKGRAGEALRQYLAQNTLELLADEPEEDEDEETDLN
jgi:hypothetical protein